MSDEIIISNTDIIDTDQQQPPTAETTARRLIAEALRRGGLKEMFAESTGKKISYVDYLAQMLWDSVTLGKFYFADGTEFQMEDYGEWLATTKMLMNHLDGPAGQDVNVGQVNIFKVYKNVDTDNV
jgi:hypothetical protein